MFFSPLKIHQQPAEESTNPSVVINPSSPPRREESGTAEARLHLQRLDGVRRVLTAGGGVAARVRRMQSHTTPSCSEPPKVQYRDEGGRENPSPCQSHCSGGSF